MQETGTEAEDRLIAVGRDHGPALALGVHPANPDLVLDRRLALAINPAPTVRASFRRAA